MCVCVQVRVTGCVCGCECVWSLEPTQELIEKRLIRRKKFAFMASSENLFLFFSSFAIFFFEISEKIPNTMDKISHPGAMAEWCKASQDRKIRCCATATKCNFIGKNYEPGCFSSRRKTVGTVS